MSSAPKVGYVLWHEQFQTPQLVDFSVRAERAGFDELWTSDHFQPWQDNQGHEMFAWITLALVAHETSRITFGTGVTCPTTRYHPSVLAQAFASLSVLAPGRVFLGAGSGEAMNEDAATGWWAPYEERAARWVEAIELIRRLWSGERVSFAGEHYKTVSAKLYDPPARPIPIQMAASGANSARLAGQHGDGWICSASDLKKPELVGAFRAGVHAAGKNPDRTSIKVESTAFVGSRDEALKAADLMLFQKNNWTPPLLWEPDPRRIEEKARQSTSPEEIVAEWAVGTDPEVHLQKLREAGEAGATHVFVHSVQPDQPTFIDFYGREVLPRLRGEPGREAQAMPLPPPPALADEATPIG